VFGLSAARWPCDIVYLLTRDEARRVAIEMVLGFVALNFCAGRPAGRQRLEALKYLGHFVGNVRRVALLYGADELFAWWRCCGLGLS